MRTRQLGFTIVEVMLFLGVTGLLLVGIIAGSSSFVSQTRFTDSMRGLESFLQLQYENVMSGVNPRLNDHACSGSTIDTSVGHAPGASNCLLLGKVVSFTADSEVVKTYTVVGSEPTSVPAEATMNEILASFEPTTVRQSVATYEIPWGARFHSGVLIGSSPSIRPDTIAFLRSPDSSQIGVYLFAADADLDASSVNLKTNVTNSSTSNSVGMFCIDSLDGITAPYQAAIKINPTQTGSSLEADFQHKRESGLC